MVITFLVGAALSTLVMPRAPSIPQGPLPTFDRTCAETNANVLERLDPFAYSPGDSAGGSYTSVHRVGDRMVVVVVKDRLSDDSVSSTEDAYEFVWDRRATTWRLHSCSGHFDCYRGRAPGGACL